jgi:eukaryotic-like serine/threonine-protein kinase
MPPEQLRAGPLTPAADVFAVAVLLIETWTGRAPFRRDSFQASVDALAEPPPRLDAADAALAPLQALIESALAHAATERPQTAEELARPLREFLRPFDLGDIARCLGERVSERLRELDDEAPRALEGVLTSELALASGRAPAVPFGSATFAARDVLHEWTAKIESTSHELASASLSDPAEIESGVTASNPSVSSDAGSGRRWHGVVSGVVPGVVPGVVFGVALASGALLALALLGQQLLYGPASAALPTARLAAVTEPPAPIFEPSAIQPAPPETAAAMPPPPRPSADSKAPHRAGAPAPLAQLQLTAEPAAWVEIDANRVGHTPLMNHGSAPGRHTITFVNQLLGERLEARVTLDPRTLTRVHADFTSANPRVYVR